MLESFLCEVEKPHYNSELSRCKVAWVYCKVPLKCDEFLR